MEIVDFRTYMYTQQPCYILVLPYGTLTITKLLVCYTTYSLQSQIKCLYLLTIVYSRV